MRGAASGRSGSAPRTRPKVARSLGRKTSQSGGRVKIKQKHMCPLVGQAPRILRAWSGDRRRSRDDRSFGPKVGECKAIDQYPNEAMESAEVHMDKGQVYPYVEQTFQKL